MCPISVFSQKGFVTNPYHNETPQKKRVVPWQTKEREIDREVFYEVEEEQRGLIRTGPMVQSREAYL